MTTQRWRTDLSMPASESTSTSSQTGHSVLETTSGTATRATTLPDCTSIAEHNNVASPGPVRYAAPTDSKVGRRRRGSGMEGSQAAAVDLDGDVVEIGAAADVLLPEGGVTAGVVQSTCPAKPTYGQRLSHKLSLTSGDASDTPNASMPEYGATRSTAPNRRAKGARDVLGVEDCVSDGVSD